jgi:hypothetical protein
MMSSTGSPPTRQDSDALLGGRGDLNPHIFRHGKLIVHTSRRPPAASGS